MNVPKAIMQNLLLGLPPIRRFAASRHITGIDGDVKRAAERFKICQSFAPVERKAVLEIGPGKTLDLLSLALQAGACSCSAVDVVRYHSDKEANRRGIVYRVYAGTHLPLADASVDLVWAFYALQHVRHPEIILTETHRVLRPGGLLLSWVDLRDHYHMHEPGRQYECLRYSTRTWNLMTWNRGSYVNRLRYSDWQKMFQKTGFEALTVAPLRDDLILEQNRHHTYLKHLHVDDVLTYQFEGVYGKQ